VGYLHQQYEPFRDLTEEELGKIRDVIDKLKVEGDLRREVSLNIKRLIEIGRYLPYLFFLVSYSTTRTFTSTRIVFRVLSANRQTSAMADSAVTRVNVA
jgi:hypothetical protein